jgi:cephalosporin-C deacetylase-like acetyl esterase
VVDHLKVEEYQCFVMLEAFSRLLCKLLPIVLLAAFGVAPKSGLFAQQPSVLITRIDNVAGHDDSSLANVGRTRLNLYLENVASKYESDRAASVAAIRTRDEAHAYQAKVRKELLSLIGSLPERTPLNPRVLGESKADGFRVRRVIFESQPDFPVCALLYLPDGASDGRKHPAILLTPGHYATGKAADADTAATFARNGFIVLSYDPIGEGERLQYPDPVNPGVSLAKAPTGEHGEASLQPMLIGDTFARYVVWDAMSGIDYLIGLPEVDSNRIGSFGCSGGGTITALTAALDTRIAAVGVACYITSFDTLLPTLGPQDAEQSSPRFISSGLDFPDLIELAAPRPYAVISTYSDMFPFAGARASVAEARRFYSLFDPANAGTGDDNASNSTRPIPTAPALNADTASLVAPTAALQFITGPGRHAALAPIMGDILSFFMRNLEPGARADKPVLMASRTSGASGSETAPGRLSKEDLQVTPTGQVATSYPDSETVFTLNRKRAAKLISAWPRELTNKELAEAIREVTSADAKPGSSTFAAELLAAGSGHFVLPSSDGIELQGDISIPASAGRHSAVILLVPDSIHEDSPIARANKTKFDALATAGNVVVAITPRPSPPGIDDMKSPLLGPFYLLSLRADLVGHTLIGMRVDDVIRTVDYVAHRPDVDPLNISAVASGHLGLVLIHAAVLDSRLKHIEVDHVLVSYRSLVDAPLTIGAPEDVIPGVLLHYDIPDLAKVLGLRLTLTYPLKGTDDLSRDSTPIDVLSGTKR